jgi:hypothetical protein
MSNNSRDHESSSLLPPLLYRPLRTRRSSYPKYVILVNAGCPIPVKHSILGHEVSVALVNSGRAFEVPPIVDDIAETICWLLEPASQLPIRCIFNSMASSLLRVCDRRTHHIHPLEAHFKLAAIAGCIIGRTYFGADVMDPEFVYDRVSQYLGVIWGEREIVYVHFKRVIQDLYVNMSNLFRCKYFYSLLCI